MGGRGHITGTHHLAYYADYANCMHCRRDYENERGHPYPGFEEESRLRHEREEADAREREQEELRSAARWKAFAQDLEHLTAERELRAAQVRLQEEAWIAGCGGFLVLLVVLGLLIQLVEWLAGGG